MTKAFLSHSSEDKSYVDHVARRLGRALITYDRNDFPPGVDFRNAIRAGMERSDLFVLFASRRSLASTWVKFEIDEAESRNIRGVLPQFLVVIVDRSVSPSDLPEWMRRAKVLTTESPNHAARIILSRLFEAEGMEQNKLFVGREELLQEIAQAIVPPNGNRSPQIIVFSGLQGVGRRSVARRALQDNLSLPFGPVFNLEATDSLDRLYLLLLEETSGFSRRDDLAAAISRFTSADVNQQASMIAEEIDKCADRNAAIVIVDQGSLMNNSGRFTESACAVFEAIGQCQREPYVAIIQRRRPPLDQSNFGSVLMENFAVPPLRTTATQRLLVQMLKSARITPPSEEASRHLSMYLDGYPPAVQLAIAYSRRYGIDALLADKSVLVELKVRTFGHLIRGLRLGEDEKKILRVLGIEPAISLDALRTITDMRQLEIVACVNKLIDNSLIVRVDEQYSLAAPIRDAVYREFGILGPEEFAEFAHRLKERYWSDPNAIPPLDVVDATIYTVARGKQRDLQELSDLIAPSALLKIASSAYHDKDWCMARDFAKRAISADSRLYRAHVIFAKSLVRLAHEGLADWSEAASAVGSMRTLGGREYFYVAGFLEWKRGNLRSAVERYTDAENAGDRGVSVYRDRAHCLYQLGEVARAEDDIKVALQLYPRNPYIVDLAVGIAIKGRHFSKAEELLGELDAIEHSRENFFHRRSTFYAALGKFEEALADAERAATRQPPLHEITANRVDILIELGRFDEASEELKTIGQRFRGHAARDVQLGLECKLALRQGRWRDAKRAFMQIRRNDLPVQLHLKAEILRQTVADSDASVADRDKATEELRSLKEKLTSLGRYGGLDLSSPNEVEDDLE